MVAETWILIFLFSYKKIRKNKNSYILKKYDDNIRGKDSERIREQGVDTER